MPRGEGPDAPATQGAVKAPRKNGSKDETGMSLKRKRVTLLHHKEASEPYYDCNENLLKGM